MLGDKDFSGGILNLQYFRSCSAPDGSCHRHSESIGTIVVPNSKIAKQNDVQESFNLWKEYDNKYKFSNV